jgi:hypothetical protein
MKKFSLILGVLAWSMFSIGCDSPTTGGSSPTKSNQAADAHAGHDHGADGHEDHDHAAHDHSAKHGGHMIEIGRNHEYHAELVDDHTTESITIYMMDSHMEPLTLNEASINLVLMAGDKTESFELLASQPGGSAEFSSNDAKMMEMIKSEDAKGKLRVNIDGKPYSGAFDHHGHGNEGKSGDSHAGHNH